ncbi:MAG: recombinase family protein [candidate division Zixibacteria bacterium]
MKAVLYARVSSEKQAEKDLSISAQLKAMRKYATKHEYTIVKEFVDKAESARTADRPAFQEMISFARAKTKPFDVVLVWKLSRFARNREDSIIYKSLLRKRGIQVISINENLDQTPAGILLEGMIEVIDEFYSINLSQDTKRGLRENSMRGFCNGGAPPYGYRHKRVIDGNATRLTLEIDPDYASIVKKIYCMSLEGNGAKEIAKTLNGEGIRTARGNLWDSYGILRILKNPMYIGVYIYARHRQLKPGEERFEIKGKHPALIKEDDFNTIQKLIEKRSFKGSHPRRTASNYLLSGLLYCGKCGKALQGGSAKSGQYQYYSCYNYLRRGKSVCDLKMIGTETLERAIIDKLKERVLTPEHLAELLELVNAEIECTQQTQKSEIDTLNKQVSHKQSKLDRLYDALESGNLDLNDLSPRIKKLKAEIDQLQGKIGSIKFGSAASAQIRSISRAELRRYTDDLYSLLNEGEFFERREFLRSFIKRININYPQVEVMYTIPIMKKPPKKSEVLSIVAYGGADETRTRDSLI